MQVNLILDDLFNDTLEKVRLDYERNVVHRKEIYESWIRCKEMGVDPNLESATIVLHGKDLTDEVERKKDFLDIAIPVIQDFYSVVQGSGFGIWISNEEGIILKGIADPDIYKYNCSGGLSVGADWKEAAVGTNAIGTCLHIKAPIQVIWTEHYCKLGQRAACSAAPVKDAEGQIVGIINMTGFKEEANPHTLALVIAVAKFIERQLHLQSLNNLVMGLIESLPSGIMLVNAEGIITFINDRASEILKADSKHFLNQIYYERLGKLNCVEKTFKYSRAHEEAECFLDINKRKLRLVISTKPILNSKGKTDAVIIILRELETVIRTTSKMAGYKARFTFDSIIGISPAFKRVINQAKSAALTTSNILILGESGTGKELIAHAIHNASPRKNAPFVALNCGALPRELIGSELFGYEEGAYTGAKKGGSPGKFELANNGTLFLDEIGEMPLDLQLVLLRVLQG
jgi:transcriptional regulator of acetoin/glycerol metabolism